MRNSWHERLKSAVSLDEILGLLFVTFEEVHMEPGARVGYVAGPISSDGPQRKLPNIQELLAYTDHVRERHDFPVFCAADIFSQGVFQNVDGHRITEEEFVTFWTTLVGSGYVTDIFMLPRWRFSDGARQEYESAIRRGLDIHYLEDLEPALREA